MSQKSRLSQINGNTKKLWCMWYGITADELYVEVEQKPATIDKLDRFEKTLKALKPSVLGA